MTREIKVDIKIESQPAQKGLITILLGIYQLQGSPNGDTEEGFQQWLIEQRKSTSQKEIAVL